MLKSWKAHICLGVSFVVFLLLAKLLSFDADKLPDDANAYVPTKQQTTHKLGPAKPVDQIKPEPDVKFLQFLVEISKTIGKFENVMDFYKQISEFNDSEQKRKVIELQYSMLSGIYTEYKEQMEFIDPTSELYQSLMPYDEIMRASLKEIENAR